MQKSTLFLHSSTIYIWFLLSGTTTTAKHIRRSTVVMLSVLRQIHLTQDQVVSHPMLFTPATVDARHQTLARAPNLRVCPSPEASDNLSYLCLLLLRFRERLVQASINKYTTFITSLLLCCLGKLTIIQDQVNRL